jgi:3-dehydro-L-gulonate 2-dehydrogenase
MSFAVQRLGDGDSTRELSDQVIRNFQSPSEEDGGQVRYPGERVLQTRREDLAKGVPVEPAVCQEVQELAA